jgi:hypothetical protein
LYSLAPSSRTGKTNRITHQDLIRFRENYSISRYLGVESRVDGEHNSMFVQTPGIDYNISTYLDVSKYLPIRHSELHGEGYQL